MPHINDDYGQATVVINPHLKRNVLRVTLAVVLILAGWSARSWATPGPTWFDVTFDAHTGEVTARCGFDCSARVDQPDSDEFGFVYHCVKAPCQVYVHGRGALNLDRSLRK